MNVPRQRRRLFIALGVNVACLVVAMAAIVGSLGFHIGWMMWLFAAAIAVGFAAHGWLMLGVWKERSPS